MSAKPISTPRAPIDEKPTRIRNYVRVEPYSKWQKLVAARMQEMDLSTRGLADKIKTKNWKTTHGTLWSWIHHKDGYPPKEAYDAAVNARLAKAIEIEPDVLAAAYEDSRRHLIFGRAQKPQWTVSLLRMLIEQSTRKSWRKEELLDLLDQAMDRS